MDDSGTCQRSEMLSDAANVYDLKPGERLFMASQALRMIPVGDNRHARTSGLLRTATCSANGIQRLVSIKNYENS